MPFDYEAAKKAGASDDEILEFLSKKNPKFDLKEAKKSGAEDSKIIDFLSKDKFKQQPSKLRSAISAPIKGAARTARGFNPLQVSIPKNKLEKILEENLPTRPEHEPLERAGKLIPYAALGGSGLLRGAGEVAAGTLAGEAAKKLGLGETGQEISEAVGLGLPGLAEAGVKGIQQLGRKFLKKETEKLPSGLTKVKAVEGKFPRAGTLSKERQAHVIEKLNKESSELAKKSVTKHLPIAEQLEKGVDFGKRFEENFSKLNNLAAKANPDIEIKPLTSFLRETQSKYRDLPTPHPDAVKIMREIDNFRSDPKSNLNTLVKIFRSNNKKRKHIYETSRLTGRQQEYVDFLGDMNREIVNSFENTLPKDSIWLKDFKEENKVYSEYLKTLDTLKGLKGFLSESPTKAEVTKLALNEKAQNKLALQMGKEGAEEVVQIAKDLKNSIESIKKIPKGQLSKFDAIFPLYALIPWIGKLIGAQKAIKVGRYVYGYWLSTPSTRKAYNEAIKAINHNDLDAYKRSTKILYDNISKDSESSPE